MTLLELTKLIEKRTKAAKVPTAKQLREGENTIIIKKELGTGYDVTVYDSGYIVYRCNGKSTVFPFFRCLESYVYTSAVEDNAFVLGFDYFKDQEFYVRMILEGERRLEHNAYEASKRVFSAYEDVPLEMQKLERRQKTFAEKMIWAEWMEEQLEMLTEKQREALKLMIYEKESKTEIAKRWGVSPAAVTDTIQRAARKLRKNMKIEDFY